MQQQTDEWFASRLGCVTASRVKDVMAKGRGGAPSATRQNYMMQLLCERLTGKREEGFTSTAMQRGNELEPVARMAYELFADAEVTETGLILHPKIEGFGASPDGLILSARGGLADHYFVSFIVQLGSNAFFWRRRIDYQLCVIIPLHLLVDCPLRQSDL